MGEPWDRLQVGAWWLSTATFFGDIWYPVMPVSESISPAPPIRGKLNDRGNYAVDIRPEQAAFHGGEEKIEISHMDTDNTPLEPPPLVTSTTGCKSKAT